jgi:hypothetical protein
VGYYNWDRVLVGYVGRDKRLIVGKFWGMDRDERRG